MSTKMYVLVVKIVCANNHTFDQKQVTRLS